MVPRLQGWGTAVPAAQHQGLRSHRVALLGATRHWCHWAVLPLWARESVSFPLPSASALLRAGAMTELSGSSTGERGNLLKQANCNDSPFPNVSRFIGERRK